MLGHDYKYSVLGRVPRPPRPSSSLSSGSGDSGFFLPSSLSQSLASSTPSPPPSSSAAHQQHINQLLLQETASLLALNAQLRHENERVRSGAATLNGILGHTPMELGRGGGGTINGFLPLPSFGCPPPLLPAPSRHPGGGMLLSRSVPNGSAGSKKAPKPDSYKTVMCAAWLESRTCVFAENCRFAHGEEELRPMKQQPRQNSKYRTKLCDKYTKTGLCPYGTRCLFIHPENGPNANAYIRSDKMAEISQRLAQVTEARENVAPGGAPFHKTPAPAFYRNVIEAEEATTDSPRSVFDLLECRSPSSGNESPESGVSPFSLSQSGSSASSLLGVDPFMIAIGNDNMARELAKQFDPWCDPPTFS